MTILIGAAVFFAWAYFWVRGHLLPALAFPAFMALMALSSYNEPGPFTTNPWHDYPLTAFLIAVSFAPYAIKRHRVAKMDRLLNGIRFKDVRGG